MYLSESFAPIYTADAQILILGSMPGLASLKAAEYYAHPRNLFWRILAEARDERVPSNYSAKLEFLARHRITLWDVLQFCERQGSLDSNIVAESERANDFAGFIQTLPKLKRIVFNGKKAEQSFRKHVLDTLLADQQAIELIGLPSTSPANASISYEEKFQRWEAALRF